MTSYFPDGWPADHPVDVARLEAAEAGTLHYDHNRYPIHAVPNNVVALIWGGLIADSPQGPRLTDAGRERLASERAARPPAPQLLSDENPELPTQPAGPTPHQLDLFG